jgi:hypothetical protein
MKCPVHNRAWSKSCHRTEEEHEHQVEGIPRIQGIDERVSTKRGGVETDSSVWKEKSCRDRVWHAEGAIWRRAEFERGDRAAKRAPDQGGPAQYRTTELSGVCQEVTFSTEPKG